MRLAASLTLVGALMATPLAGQTKIVPGLGLGIDLADNPYTVVFGGTGGITTNILVPVMVGPHVRLQPWVGYFKLSYDQSSTTSNTQSKFRRVTLGLAAHYLFAVQEAVRVYLGGGFGYSWSKEESKFTDPQQTASAESEETRSDRTMNVVAGGEYFFSSRFSVGGEVRIDYITFGQPKFSQTISPPPPVPPPTPPPVAENLTLTQTNAQVTVRWYFGDAR